MSNTSDVNIGDAATATQYNNLRKDVYDNAMVSGATAGSSNAYTLSVDSSYAAYSDQSRFTFKANHTNSGAATLNINSIGAKSIKKNAGLALVSGDIRQNQSYEVIYNSTGDYFELQTPTSSSSKFGGDASDGAIDGSADETITGSNNTYIVKNYESWAAAQGGGKICSVTPTGCIVHLKIAGDADFTNWTFNFNAKGFAGGNNGVGNYPANATDGSAGQTPSTGIIFGHTGGAGGEGGGGASSGSNTGGGAGGGGGASAFNDGTAGSDSTGGTASGGTRDGGEGGIKLPFGINVDYLMAGRTILVFPGAGGGGGGGGGDAGLSAPNGQGGDGGYGGGALIIEVLGDLTFSGSTFNVYGEDGEDAPNNSSGDGGGGGGGGGGGTLAIIYGGALSGSPTVDATGGVGGLGQTANTYNGADGGDGGDGDYSLLKNTVFS